MSGRGRRVTGAVTVLRSPSAMPKVSVIVPVFEPGSDIDELSEEGVGPLLLFVEGHEVKSLTGTLGLNARTAFATPFGSLLPSLRAELVHEFEDSARLVTARFLRDRLNTSFTVPVDQPDANYGRIGAGLQAVFPFGWSASIEANQDVMRNDLKFRNVQFTVYKSF